MRFGVLGPVTVVEGADTLNLGGPKQRTVLAMLIAHVGQHVSSDTLVHAVYGDDAAANSRRRIQVYVSTLRSVVGDAIIKAGSGWKLDIPKEDIDAGLFENLFRMGRDLAVDSPDRAGETLREALALWRGHPYADVEGHGMLDGETRRLSELRIAAQGARIDSDLACGRHADLVGEIEALLAEHPYVESFRAQHMLALYRSGRQKEALRSYAEMRNLLTDELGVDPTPDLQDLEQRILEQDASLRLQPRTSIQRRAVLVADPGDPVELARLPGTEREELLGTAATILERLVSQEGGGILLHSGTTSYGIFDTIGGATSVAEQATRRLGDSAIRLSIDHGDIELVDGSAGGAPVTRAALLAAAAHPGQVLISSHAQQALLQEHGGRGLRFESLGEFELMGVRDPVGVYQLLVGDPPTTFPPLDTNRLPPPLPGGAHLNVPGYELRDPIGGGAVGTLFRAYQPAVGREVVVEVMERGEASDAEFVRRFEADAQRLALLDHPNINQVIDYWRDPGGAYIVYRDHRGGFLQSGAAASSRMLEQVAAALAYAHSYGMVHGSLRPDRIALDEEGNAYLMGFPLGGIPPKSAPEFPQFIPPELIEGRAPTVASDVYALGVLAHEIESGEADRDVALSPDSPAVARAVSDEPSERQTSVAEFMADLAPLDPGFADRFTQTRNPYKGLAAFHESDAADFFGRASVVDELIRAFTGGDFLAVVGPSGIGKSSVVRAGLLPALRNNAIDGSDRWVITEMLPGPRPFIELERALERVAVSLPPDAREGFADRSANGLAGLSRVLPEGSELLLVIDQFEELFTLAEDGVASAFLDLLTTSVKHGQARVVITLRADFLDRPLLFSEFGELMRDSMVVIRSPSPSELSEAISGPVRRLSVDVDTTLVERLVSEVHDRPGGLPLLQFAMVELFDSRTSDLLTLESYAELGGVTGSVARRAEAVYGELNPGQQEAIKQFFLRLVTVVDDSPPTRRRVRVDALEDLGADEGMEAFARSRMLVFDSDPNAHVPTVEVAHEALLAQWPRLAGWIESTREDLTLSRRLDEAVQDWRANDEDDAYLLTGGRLAQHEAWTESTTLALTDVETEFLEASTAHDHAITSRRRRRRNVVTTVIAGVAVVASVFGLIALNRSSDARAEALAASSVAALDTDPELSLLLGVAAMDVSTTSRSARTALNQALQAHRAVLRIEGPSLTGSISPDGSLLAVSTPDELQVFEPDAPDTPLWSWPVYADHDIVETYFSADGRSVITVTLMAEEVCSWDRFTVFDARTGAIEAEKPSTGLNTYLGGPAQNGPFVDLEQPIILSQGGAETCTQTPDESVLYAVDLHSGRQTELIIGATAAGRSFTGMPTLSADGARLATTGFGGGSVLELDSGDELLELERGFSTLSPDGKLVLAGNNPLELWNVADKEKLREFKADFAVAWFSPTGSMIYGATNDGRVLVFDVASADLLFELRGQGSAAVTIQMSDDESRIASFAEDAVTVWDVSAQLRSTAGSSGFPASLEDECAFFQINDLYVTPDVLLAKRAVFPHEAGGCGAVEFPATSGYDETTVFDLETGAVVNSYLGSLVAVSPSGEVAAIQTSEGLIELEESPGAEYVHYGPIVIADTETGEPITRLEGLCEWYLGPSRFDDFVVTDGCEGYPGPWREYVHHAEFSDDGSLLAMAGQSGRYAMWDVVTGEMIWSRDSTTGVSMALYASDTNLAFAPDGEHLAISVFNDASRPNSIVILEVGSFDEVDRFDLDAGGPTKMEFTPDGRFLVFNDQNLNVNVVGTESWDLVHTLRGQQGAWFPDISLDPTGRLVATAGLDGVSIVWDVETGEEVQRFILPGIPFGLRNVEWVDETTLMLGARPWAILVTVDPDVLVETARSRFTRSFTDQECATYDIDPCPTLDEMRSNS